MGEQEGGKNRNLLPKLTSRDMQGEVENIRHFSAASQKKQPTGPFM